MGYKKSVRVSGYTYERKGKTITVPPYTRTVYLDSPETITVKSYSYQRDGKTITVPSHTRLKPQATKEGLRKVKGYKRDSKKVKSYKRTLPEVPENRYKISVVVGPDKKKFFIKHNNKNSLRKQLEIIRSSYKYKNLSDMDVRTVDRTYQYNPFDSRGLAEFLR